MAKIREKISWVLSDSAELDPTLETEHLKKLGSFWGSWRTWRAFATDNVICHDQIKASDLVKRNFQNSCNFFIPESVNVSLDRPSGLRVYAGEFVHDVIKQEEIVAMHLAATTSDIILLLGWDLTKLEPTTDLLRSNQNQHHRNLVRQAFVTYDRVQWVIIDHALDLDPNIAKLDNVVTDSLNNVLDMV